MNLKPIVLIDDDSEDLELMQTALIELKISNEVLPFTNADRAFEFITTTKKKPFLILCDINMNGTNGLELRKKIHNNDAYRLKSIPFLFLSTSKTPQYITEAYALSAQGYFVKPGSMEEIKSMLKCIIDYWGICQNPNQYQPFSNKEVS